MPMSQHVLFYFFSLENKPNEPRGGNFGEKTSFRGFVEAELTATSWETDYIHSIEKILFTYLKYSMVLRKLL